MVYSRIVVHPQLFMPLPMLIMLVIRIIILLLSSILFSWCQSHQLELQKATYCCSVLYVSSIAIVVSTAEITHWLHKLGGVVSVVPNVLNISYRKYIKYQKHIRWPKSTLNVRNQRYFGIYILKIEVSYRIVSIYDIMSYKQKTCIDNKYR